MSYVKRIIDDWDPIGLLCHAPNDEYHSEIDEIQQLLLITNDCDELAEGILNTFIKSFGEELFNGSKAECNWIAQRLLLGKAEKKTD